jgi:nucleotide-binding universal stress UspA family protein
MTIVCGIDFSENSLRAAEGACAIARQLKKRVKLVHIVADVIPYLAESAPAEALFRAGVQASLSEEASKLHQRFGIEVEPVTLSGVAEDELVKVAQEAAASLIVVASLGAKKQDRWLVGSVAERVCQLSPIPVLVVRDAASLEAWARGDRPLRVMVGAGLDASAKAALTWAAELRAVGACDLSIVQVAWPFGEHARLGISGPVPLDQLEPALEAILLRDLRAWAGEIPGPGETTFSVCPGLGRVDTHLTQRATAGAIDLLVVGTHRRAGVARLWQGSVSRGVIQYAPSNVVCVPPSLAAEANAGIRTFRSVLIATDFSTLGNRALSAGYGMLPQGGTVHLLHVVSEKSDAGRMDLKARLSALIPAGAAASGIASEVHVLYDDEVALGIWHAAGRLGVDAICMATHSRVGLGQILGSEAQAVVRRAKQPVLLVTPEP